MKGLDASEVSVADRSLLVCPGPATIGGERWSPDEEAAVIRMHERGLLYVYECPKCKATHPYMTTSGREVLRIVKSLEPK